MLWEEESAWFAAFSQSRSPSPVRDLKVFPMGNNTLVFITSSVPIFPLPPP